MPKRTPLQLNLDEARGLQLAAQQLFDAPPPHPDGNALARLIDHLGVVQIDTISVVARSQYLVLWSRLGPFDPKLLGELLYPRRTIFEYWSHVASILPMTDYPYHRLNMLTAQEDHPYDGVRDWLTNEHTALSDTLRQIRERGPLASADFERAPDAQRTGPWDWYGPKESRRALEILWMAGELMIHSRRAGQKVYDLRERVLADLAGALPSDDALPTPADQVRHFARRSSRALGVVTPAWLWDYFRLRPRLKYVQLLKSGRIGNIPRSAHPPKRGKNGNGAPLLIAANDGAALPLLAGEGSRGTRSSALALAHAALDEQVRDGALVPATIAGIAGPAYVAAERLPDLERLRAGVQPSRTTLLSPFDNLIWDRARTRALLNYEVVFEAYVLAEKRRFGYYCLAILHRGQLVGRVDLKADRAAKTLLARALYLEPGVPVDDALVSGLAASLLDLARFLNLLAVRLGSSNPPALAPALLEHLGSHA